MSTAESLPDCLTDKPLRIGSHTLLSRLIVGTGKYDTFETMQESLAMSGADCITVAVRRERLYDGRGKNILDFLDLSRYTLLPNTAGCYNAADAVRVARMGCTEIRGQKSEVSSAKVESFFITQSSSDGRKLLLLTRFAFGHF